jgi:hypothetical protein
MVFENNPSNWSLVQSGLIWWNKLWWNRLGHSSVKQITKTEFMF